MKFEEFLQTFPIPIMNLSLNAQIEYSLLETLVQNGQKQSMDLSVSNEFLENFVNQKYEGCSKEYQKVLGKKLADFQTFDEFKNFLGDVYINSKLEQRLEIMAIAVANLQEFVQVNFTGRPEIECDDTQVPWLVSSVLLDGETLSPVVKNLEKFVIARNFLSIEHQDHVVSSLAVKWWKSRCLWVHQELLEERSEIIFKEAREIYDNMNLDSMNEEGQIQFHLEVATFNLKYFDINLIKDEVKKAADLAGISIEETGALGKRTKWQQKEVAQLTLHIKKANIENGNHSKESIDDLPTDLKLDDEVRLDKIAFSEDREISDLSLTHCAVLLAQYFCQKRSKPKDELLKEELMPYLDAILNNRQTNWCLKFIALLERSKFEKEEKRGIERALMQLQTLVDSLQWKEESKE